MELISFASEGCLATQLAETCYIIVQSHVASATKSSELAEVLCLLPSESCQEVFPDFFIASAATQHFTVDKVIAGIPSHSAT